MKFRPCSKIYAYYPQVMHNTVIDCQKVILKKLEKYVFSQLLFQDIVVKAKFDLTKQSKFPISL